MASLGFSRSELTASPRCGRSGTRLQMPSLRPPPPPTDQEAAKPPAPPPPPPPPPPPKRNGPCVVLATTLGVGALLLLGTYALADCGCWGTKDCQERYSGSYACSFAQGGTNCSTGTCFETSVYRYGEGVLTRELPASTVLTCSAKEGGDNITHAVESLLGDVNESLACTCGDRNITCFDNSLF